MKGGFKRALPEQKSATIASFLCLTPSGTCRNSDTLDAPVGEWFCQVIGMDGGRQAGTAWATIQAPPVPGRPFGLPAPFPLLTHM